MTPVVILVAQLAVTQAGAAAGVFYRPGIDTEGGVWGLREGIRLSVWPYSVSESADDGGPRGLLRIGYPMLEGNRYGLVNFIAIEPVAAGSPWRSYSELEHSARDGAPGMFIEVGPPPGVPWEREGEALYPGHVEEVEGHARLSICLRVEPFSSGAHVYVVAAFRSDRPDEVEFRSYREDDSVELSACILTATMGNYERLRQLHVRGGILTAADLYGDYNGPGFTEHTVVPAADLPRTPDGDVLIAATTDEADPASVYPDPDRPWFWHYPGLKVTQYWRKPAEDLGEDLCAQVNGRRVYWGSEWPIPGGVAFENFELVEAFRPGRPVIFAITPQGPEALIAASG